MRSMPIWRSRMSNLLDFPELLQYTHKKDIEIVPYLSLGLQPYTRHMEEIGCPERHHQYSLNEERLVEIDQIVRAMRMIGSKKDEETETDGLFILLDTHDLFLLLAAIRKKHPDVLVDGFYTNKPPWRSIHIPHFTPESTIRITDDFIKKMESIERDILDERDRIESHQAEIDEKDPLKISWEFFHEPYLGEYSWTKRIFSSEESPAFFRDIWPDDQLDALFDILKEAYYKKDNVQLVVLNTNLEKVKRDRTIIEHAKRIHHSDPRKSKLQVAREIKETHNFELSEQRIAVIFERHVRFEKRRGRPPKR